MHYNFCTKRTRTQRGFTLFIALVTVSIILALGISILNITLKEYLLSSTARESEIAFSAADAGMECGLFWSNSVQAGVGGKFATAGNTISCMGVSNTVGGALGTKNTFQIEWGSPTMCTKIEVGRYDAANPHPDGDTCILGTCTKIVSRGYNRGCANISDAHAVERALQGYYYAP